MGLLEVAQRDNKIILNDKAKGFGLAIFLTDPAGVEVELTGFANDISDLFDPETGQAINSRLVSVALHIADILSAAFATVGLPRGIEDEDSKPWLAKFTDLNGLETQWKVFKSNPDHGLGMITLILERWDDGS